MKMYLAHEDLSLNNMDNNNEVFNTWNLRGGKRSLSSYVESRICGQKGLTDRFQVTDISDMFNIG